LDLQFAKRSKRNARLRRAIDDIYSLSVPKTHAWLPIRVELPSVSAIEIKDWKHVRCKYCALGRVWRSSRVRVSQTLTGYVMPAPTLAIARSHLSMRRIPRWHCLNCKGEFLRRSSQLCSCKDGEEKTIKPELNTVAGNYGKQDVAVTDH
jgi:hypothetical protein